MADFEAVKTKLRGDRLHMESLLGMVTITDNMSRDLIAVMRGYTDRVVDLIMSMALGLGTLEEVYSNEITHDDLNALKAKYQELVTKHRNCVRSLSEKNSNPVPTEGSILGAGPRRRRPRPS
jgi:hypothetical protein